MVAVRVGFREGVSLPFVRQDVQQDRPVKVPDVAEDRDELVHVVTVDRPVVVEAERLEKRARHERALDPPLKSLGQLRSGLAHSGQPSQQRVDLGLHAGVVGVGGQAGQVVRDGADVRADRHGVVVQHDEHVPVRVAGVVHRLEGQSPGHRAVTDHGHDPVVETGEIAGGRETEGGRHRGRGVPGAELVVIGFVAAQEPAHTAVLTDRPHPLPPAGQDLVHVGLVADVPDDLVRGGVEDLEQRDRQLDDAEARGEVPALGRDDLDDVLADFPGKLLELLAFELADVRG